MAKHILVLYPNGHEIRLVKTPSWQTMQQLVGGDVEQVAILDRIEDGRYVFTYMYVNENGFGLNLPRNPAATVLYQANVRAAFPGSATPFLDAKMVAEAQGAHVIDTTPLIPGYADDPWVCGVAVVFQGWTCDEVDLLWQ